MCINTYVGKIEVFFVRIGMVITRILTKTNMPAVPRKTLPYVLVSPKKYDYERWWASERRRDPTTLSPEDAEWYTRWDEDAREVGLKCLAPNPSTSGSWIEYDPTFILYLSTLDQ